MLRKIYKELAAIRDELRAIREELNLGNRMIVVRRPYGAREEVVTVREGLQILDGLEPGGIRSLSCRPYTPVHKSGNEKRFGSSKEPMMWRRFELLAEDEAERIRLEGVLTKHGLSRQDLAVILFGLRVQPGFGKKDFGI